MDKMYKFPPLNLLLKSNFENIQVVELKEKALKIQQILLSYGIRVSVIDIIEGTRFTRYEIIPDVGMRIKDIVKRKEDIELSLATTGIHIEAPIPGKSAIGIDVPKVNVSPVRIRSIIEDKEFLENPSNLLVGIGKDMYGKAVVFDIAKMPHLLIGGCTGSGKSVFINSLIMSIFYKASPNDVRFVFIDTKAVNLAIYNGIPHLLIPVVTDANKALVALRQIIAEAQDRYRRFTEHNVQDLKSYNINVEKIGNLPQMPKILIVIDDFSDLMAINPRETEKSIVDLTRLARGVGIHLIISAQRPSTDVVTGLIKTNIPSRIAFAAFSAMDSRVILEDSGAEELLGNGDMLFKPQGCLKPIRIQGAYVSDEEIYNVVEFLKMQNYSDSMKKAENIPKEKECYDSKWDNYFFEVGRFVIEKGQSSIGLIQGEFKIGFSRANRIINQLYEFGVVGEEMGTTPRKVLMSLDDFERKFYGEEYIDIRKKEKIESAYKRDEEVDVIIKGNKNYEHEKSLESNENIFLDKKVKKYNGNVKGKKRIIFIVLIVIVLLGFINYISDENKEKINGDNQKENFELSTKEELQEREKSQEKNEIYKETEMSVEENENNLFPQTEKYIVNNTLLKYNEIAQYPIDDEFIEEMIKIERPLSKATITISNGIYFVIQYNDYNQTLFIDYQEETNDDSDLYAVMRDMIKVSNPKIEDEEIEKMWEELETGNYSNYYGDRYSLKGFEITFSTTKINNGQTRYDIKTSYKN